jgi:hypothetical protein
VPRHGKASPPKAAKEILDLSLINNEQAKAKEGALINRYVWKKACFNDTKRDSSDSNSNIFYSL